MDFSLELIRSGWRDHAAENSNGCQKKQSEISHLPHIASHIAFVIRSKMTVVSFASDLLQSVTFKVEKPIDRTSSDFSKLFIFAFHPRIDVDAR